MPIPTVHYRFRSLPSLFIQLFTYSRYRSILLSFGILIIANYGWWITADDASNRQAYLGNIFRIYNREPSYPLVTGDGFRAISNHVCDETGCLLAYVPFMHRFIHRGDKIFLKADYLGWYLRELAPRITVPHILIVHNGDMGLLEKDINNYLAWVNQNKYTPDDLSTSTTKSSMEPSVRQIFLPNVPPNLGTEHPLITCIPLGIENRQYLHGRQPEIYLQYTTKEINLYNNLDYYIPSGSIINSGSIAAFNTLATQRKLIFAAFDIGTNPIERTYATLAFLNKPWVTIHISIGSTLQSLVTIVPTDPLSSSSNDIYVQTKEKDKPNPVRIPTDLLREVQEIITLQKMNTVPLPSSVFSQSDFSSSLHDETLKKITLDPHYEQYLRSVTNHLFVVSPPGNGRQAHRTWETLLLGSIPIVRRSLSPEDHLYDGLPVVLVNHYYDVTLHRLFFIIRFFKRIMDNTRKYKHELKKYDEYRTYPAFKNTKESSSLSSSSSSLLFTPPNYVPLYRPYSPTTIDITVFDNPEERTKIEQLEWVFMFHRLESTYWNEQINRWAEYIKRSGDE